MTDETTHTGSDPVEEFEREPVPPRARLGLGCFVGMYAGEHVGRDGTDVGPLFLASGVAAWDLSRGSSSGTCWRC